jgi:hypothetical protein
MNEFVRRTRDGRDSENLWPVLLTALCIAVIIIAAVGVSSCGSGTRPQIQVQAPRVPKEPVVKVVPVGPRPPMVRYFSVCHPYINTGC